MGYVPLGQYIWKVSYIHQLDPRVKIIATIIIGMAVVAADSWLDFFLLASLIIGLGIGSQISIADYCKGISPFWLIIVITALFQLFLIGGDSCLEIFSLNISLEGIKSAISISTQLFLIAYLAQILVLTTPSVTLTDGFGLLVSPLGRVGLPVNELVFIMNTSLQFIPILLNESRRIRLVQLSRGISFTEGSRWERTKAYFAILIPLINAAFEQANSLAESMEARCYRVGLKRSRLNELKLKSFDYFYLSISSIIVGITILPAI